jgi:putative ABC transport system permease protein
MIKSYFTIALRSIHRHQVFSLINILGLAIGMAACMLVLLYVRDELSYDRTHEKADRIYRVAQHAHWEGGTIDAAVTSGPFAPFLKKDYPEVQQAVRIATEGSEFIKYGDKTLKTPIIVADPNLFDVFTHRFLYGSPTKALGNLNAIVLTKTTAENIFGHASQAVGKTLQVLNRSNFIVSGVVEDVPTNSHFRFGAALPLDAKADFLKPWQNFSLYTYLLLPEGYDIARLQAKMPAFYQRYLGKEMGAGVDFLIDFQPLTSIHLHSHLQAEMEANGDITYVYIFSVIAAFILLLACINSMNLATARSASRAKEVGIRKVVGSSRQQLIGQFMTESFLLTGLSLAISLLLVEWLLPFFNQITEKQLHIPWLSQPISIGLLLLVAVATALVSGSYPAFFLSHFRPITILKGTFIRNPTNAFFRKGLVVFQFTVSIALITATWIAYEQLAYVRNKELGFNKEQLIGVRIPDYQVRHQLAAVKTHLLQNPAILGAAATTNPIGRDDIGSGVMFFEENGKKPELTHTVKPLGIDTDYLGLMQIQLKEGRNFSPTMPTDSTQAVIINEALVKELGWKNALGKRIWYFIDDNGHTAEAKVIGVVKDFHIASLHQPIEPLVLRLVPQDEADNLYVRLRPENMAATLDFIRKTHQSFDAYNPLETYFIDQNFARQYEADARRGQLFLAFAGLAIFIACLGLFGLAAFTAEQRTKEIGIRKVMGASVNNIVTLLSKDFVKLVLLANIIAVPLAWWAMQRWLEDFAYRVQISWWMFVLAGVLALVIALLTVSYQAVKAAVANPVKSLRTE